MAVDIPYYMRADVTVGSSLIYCCLLDSLTEVSERTDRGHDRGVILNSLKHDRPFCDRPSYVY
jgi:hypothetical protein